MSRRFSIRKPFSTHRRPRAGGVRRISTNPRRPRRNRNRISRPGYIAAIPLAKCSWNSASQTAAWMLFHITYTPLLRSWECRRILCTRFLARFSSATDPFASTYFPFFVERPLPPPEALSTTRQVHPDRPGYPSALQSTVNGPLLFLWRYVNADMPDRSKPA